MSKTYIVQGKARFAKIIGKPTRGYGTEPGDGELEWTFDLVLDADGKASYAKSGADKFYLKEKDGVEYLRFTRKAVKKDGEPAKPIQVVDAQGRDWDQTKLIGNDSVLNCAFALNEAVYKGKKRMKPSILSVQVWEHVPYRPKTSFPTKPIEEADESAPTNW